MRDDMAKVLVDSLRVGRAQARALAGSRRLQRHRLDPDGEGAAQHVGMRRDAIDRKHFGEHLAPLYRYLHQQVNRPWAKVYSELCAGLDRRSVVQAHLFEHLESRVAIATVWRDGEILVPFWGRFDTLAESRVELFVHPRTGILLPNRARLIAAQRRKQARAAHAEEPHPDRRAGLPGMAPDCQWHRVDGLWYEVRMASLDALGAGAAAYDVLLKRNVDGRQHALLSARYGGPALYAMAKRQLGGAALRANGLRSGID